MNAYQQYLREEWDQCCHDPARAAVAAEIRRHTGAVRRVLDVGCGAGQELIPFLHDALCIGVDLAPDAPPMARQLLREVHADGRLAFSLARAEALPIGAGQIDLVICRLVLPYAHTPSALSEVARVLRPAGTFSVQIHSPRYYVRKLRRAVAGRDGRSLRYAARVLRTGVWFHLSGRHRAIRGTLETFLTISRLRRMASAAHLDLVARIENGNPHAPHFLFRRS